MFIISLYHKDLVPLPHKPQRDIYGQSQINHIKGFRTPVIGNRFPEWYQPLFSDALPCRTTQIDRAFKQGHRFADGNVACVRQLLGKAFPGGGHQRLANPPRAWTQAYHGLYGRRSCPQGIEQDRQSVSKAREAWQKATGKEASDLTFKRFLSALAQDISE